MGITSRRTLAALLSLPALLLLSACQEFSAGATGGAGGQSSDSGAAAQAQGGTDSGGAAATANGNGGAAAGEAAGGTPAGGSGGSVQGAAGSSTGGSAGAGSECPCEAPTPSCEAGKCIVRGPNMVQTNSFYTDSTEVTVAQYALFLKAKAKDTKGQAKECAWNDSYEPLFEQGLPPILPNQPVTNIDYCDAAAFCSWADKQLCAKIGGGELQSQDLADPQKSQWFLACAGPEGQGYPYGAAFKSGACNDGTPASTLAVVRSYRQCQGYFLGLYDMIGNALEWTGTCLQHTGKGDTCERIGGSFAGATTCDVSSAAVRDKQAHDLGFRCCSK